MRTPQVKIAPSILTADWGHLAAQVREAEEGGADYMHLDVMDGTFVPNITFGPLVVKAVDQMTELPLDVHLMVAEPSRYLEAFRDAGADILTVHAEACLHLHSTVQQITRLGCRASVAINPATSIDALREIAPFVDMILIMSVNPGFGGQRFIETATSKLRRMRQMLNELNPTCDLQVDGGVGPANIGDVVEAGANVVVAGSAVYNDRASIAENIAALRAGYANARA